MRLLFAAPSHGQSLKGKRFHPLKVISFKGGICGEFTGRMAIQPNFLAK